MNVVERAGVANWSDADAVRAVTLWLEKFEAALARRDDAALGALFHDDSHWRDLLAFTWHITGHNGARDITTALIDRQAKTKAHAFRVATGRTTPRIARRLGRDVIEAFYDFETDVGRGAGVLRLTGDGSAAPETVKAWIISTTLQELKGFEEQVGDRRPSGDAYSRNFGGDNWQDQRDKEQAFADRDPAVLVIGAGQAGLAIAARLRQLGIDTLVVEKNPRIGDNWRTRYHSLALHNELHVNHLPYLPFPPTWPVFIPKDMLGGWFEFYAFAMELNVWTSTEFKSARYDEAAGHWSATLTTADGSERTMKPRHIIFANGVSGIPKIPELPGLRDFKGKVTHAHGFTDGSEYRGKKALIIGTGNSAHDIAQDLHSHDVDTTIVQRGSTTVVSIDPSAKMNYALYSEGPPLEDCDLLASAGTYPLVIRGYQMAVQRMIELDKDLIAGLVAKGFKYDIGADKTGHQMKYQRRGGGYYLNAGCSDLIIAGEVGLMPYDTIERFTAEGALLKDGSTRPADLIVLATGYHTQTELVRRVLGEDVAERVGPIWG
ncbi:MAG: NAD(P)/FAD-dependent oxidoreductase, partial [Alphaproteobacteria bacterium]|nr:NAD(P)/FAD-dependent oxidoreductase [Alphaproteobacteria bacterium]